MVNVGNGAEQPELIEKCRKILLVNMMLHQLQPIERLSERLATAGVSVIPQKRAP